VASSRQLRDSLDRAGEAFDEVSPRSDREPGLPTAAASLMEIQMAKACRMLELANDLVSDNKALKAKAYYTACVEVAFAVIERSLHAYLLAKEVVDEEDFLGHEGITKLAGRAGLMEQAITEDLEDLWRKNRSKVYYRSGLPTRQAAEAMLELAIQVHQSVRDLDRKLRRLCIC